MSTAMPYFENNIIKGWLYCVLMLIPAMYVATWAAPLLTEAYIAGGGTLQEGGNLITVAVPYIWSYLLAFLAQIF